MKTVTSLTPPEPLTTERAISELTAPERKALVDELTTMVRTMAQRVSARVPKNVDLDDLLSAGMIGLFDALEKFDSAKASDLRKYAGIRVKGAILDELRAQDPLSRTHRKKARELERSAQGLGQELGRAPSDQEMAQHLNMGLEGYRTLAAAFQSVRFTSIDQVAEDGGDVSSWLTDRGTATPQDLLESKDLRALVERELAAMSSKRHEHALRFCFFDDLSNREIAKIIGVSESRASQLLTEALGIFAKRMRAALRKDVALGAIAPKATPVGGVRWQLGQRS